jgi:DNA helicase-2/ATP-dependent DNA helicase PcrA
VPIAVIETYNEQEEAQFAVNEIEQTVSRGEARLNDFAIMYRTNAQSRVLEEAFLRYGVPYRLVAGTRFYERREVKDVIAYLRLILNPNDNVSFLRIINVPQRGIGERSVVELGQWARSLGVSTYEALKMLADPTVKSPLNPRAVKQMLAFYEIMADLTTLSKELNVVDLFDLVVERSGYKDYLARETDGEERWENVLELRTVAQEYRDVPSTEGLCAFLEGVTLVSDVDSLDQSVAAVTLITLHQAKGLEFPIVFIVGMEEGILPHIRSFDDADQMEEERRLCYVGITRAKKRVYLVRAFKRSLMGSSRPNPPSRFLRDIPPHLITGGSLREVVEESRVAAALSAWNRSIAKADLTELKAGDRVRHAQFGEGVVVSYKPGKDDAEVTVAFEGTGVKKLLQSFARLEKVE